MDEDRMTATAGFVKARGEEISSIRPAGFPAG